MATFGERIKELRKVNKMTQDELGTKVGVTKSTVSSWEAGKREPGFEVVDTLCSTLEASIDYILGHSDTNSYRENEITQSGLDDLGMTDYCDDLYDATSLFARLDEYGKAAVKGIIRIEYDRCRAEKTLSPKGSIIIQIYPSNDSKEPNKA